MNRDIDWDGTGVNDSIDEFIDENIGEYVSEPEEEAGK